LWGNSSSKAIYTRGVIILGKEVMFSSVVLVAAISEMLRWKMFGFL
jgi:hypothetical protein